MRSVILCEGADDLWFLAYYIHKVCRWETATKNKWNGGILPCKKEKQEVLYMQKPGTAHFLAILATGGQDNMKESVEDVLHINSKTSENPIDNLIIFRDCDDRNQTVLLREMESWFPNSIRLSNHSVSNYVMDSEYADFTLYILPLIIPFDEPGAIETLLTKAISDTGTEGKYLVAQANAYIDTVKPNLTTFLRKKRMETKARYASVMAVYDPTHSRDTFAGLMNSTPWEKSAAIRFHMEKVVDLIDGEKSTAAV